MGLTDVRTQIHVCFEEMKGEDNLKGGFRIHIASFKIPNLNLVFSMSGQPKNCFLVIGPVIAANVVAKNMF